MINKKYLKLIRSRKYLNDDSFIYEITSQRIIDSIDLIKIPFNNDCNASTHSTPKPFTI